MVVIPRRDTVQSQAGSIRIRAVSRGNRIRAGLYAKRHEKQPKQYTASSRTLHAGGAQEVRRLGTLYLS